MAAKIRKGDQVIVLAGRDKVHSGEGREVTTGGEGRQGWKAWKRGRRAAGGKAEEAGGARHPAAQDLFRRGRSQEAGGRIRLQESPAGAGDRKGRDQYGHRRRR